MMITILGLFLASALSCANNGAEKLHVSARTSVDTLNIFSFIYFFFWLVAVAFCKPSAVAVSEKSPSLSMDSKII